MEGKVEICSKRRIHLFREEFTIQIEKREKTLEHYGHALMITKNHLNNPFIVINAD